MIYSSFQSSFRKKPAPKTNDHIRFVCLYFRFHLVQNNVLTAKKLVEQKNKSITKFQSSHKCYEKVGSQLQGEKKIKPFLPNSVPFSQVSVSIQLLLKNPPKSSI